MSPSSQPSPSSITPARPTRSQRRDDARAEALRLREEQQRQARRQRVVVLSLLVVGLIAVGGVVAFVVGNRPAGEDFAQPPAAPDLSEVEQPLADVTAPAGATDDGGILVGADGVAVDVDIPDDAVVVEVYEDFMCPFCGLFEETNGESLTEMREAGEVVVEYHVVSILDRASVGSSFSTRSATAAAHIADRSPAAFVDFVAGLYDVQPQEGTPGPTDAELAALAEEAGADAATVAAIADGSYVTADESFVPWVHAATEEASRRFAPQLGTPAVLVDGENLSDLGVDWRIPGALADAVEAARG